MMAYVQNLAEEAGAIDELVDKAQLHNILFRSEADELSESNELLSYLLSEGQELSEHLAVSTTARIIIDELIDDTENFRLRFLEMKKELEACQGEIEMVRNQGFANDDAELLEKEHQMADIRLKMQENDGGWVAANDRIDMAQSRLRLFDRRFFIRAKDLIQGSGLLDGKVDEEMLRRQLFEGEHIGSQDGDEAQEQPQNEDEANTQADQELKDAERDAAREERAGAISAALDVAELLASRMEGYHTALNQHLNGQDPGIPDWSPSWSKEEFDLRRLRHLQQLTGEQIAAERRCMRAIIRARDAGVEPIESMRFAFADRTDDGAQGSGDGTRAIATAPRRQVREWLESIPVTPTRLRNDQPGSPASDVPDLRTPMNWESFSTRATPDWRDRFIQEAGPRGPRGETPEPVPEVGENKDLFEKFRNRAQGGR
ncbi:hypothetical protein HII31_12335 [Pseudocercospora fuligena]|uniref:Uncharacterized protein n=1 Tax=Pseudocercospora fuligena TaxID=685502 RepID=A0A8H6VGQ2_9PEZI|nr:hypothetical protein HII31_12335 [Pseudocercospora fuligena]